MLFFIVFLIKKLMTTTSNANLPNGIISTRLLMLFDKPSIDHDIRQKYYTWDSEFCSANLPIDENDATFVNRLPIAQTTDVARTKMGYSSGIHLWEVNWPTNQRGTHAYIGVATKNYTQIQCPGYQSILGNSVHSWGWNLSTNLACHNSKSCDGILKNYPHFYHEKEHAPNQFYMCLDMDLGTLSFIANGVHLGVAFSNLHGLKLYPIISSVWGFSKIQLKYINGIEFRVPPLLHLCRHVIRHNVGRQIMSMELIEKNFEIPKQLKRFLLFK